MDQGVERLRDPKFLNSVNTDKKLHFFENQTQDLESLWYSQISVKYKKAFKRSRNILTMDLEVLKGKTILRKSIIQVQDSVDYLESLGRTQTAAVHM